MRLSDNENDAGKARVTQSKDKAGSTGLREHSLVREECLDCRPQRVQLY